MSVIEAACQVSLASISAAGRARPTGPARSSRSGRRSSSSSCRAGDPLRERAAPIALSPFAERDWVLVERGHALAALTETLCAGGASRRGPPCARRNRRGARPRGRRPGPALVSVNIVAGPQRRSARHLDPPPAHQLCAFTRDAGPPLARAFLDLLAEQPWPEREARAIAVRSRSDAAPRRTEQLARLRDPRSHPGLRLGAPRPRVVGALVTEPASPASTRRNERASARARRV